MWINQGDIVLLSLRDFQDDKADVIVKYTADEARNCTSHIRTLRSRSTDSHYALHLPFSVKAYGELPENAKINEDDFGEENDECTFEFKDEVDIDDI